MKSFKQYLQEEQVTLFHRTYPEAAEQIKQAARPGGKGRRPLSVFTNVTHARRYHGERSNGMVQKGGTILSTPRTRGAGTPRTKGAGTPASTKHLIPDIEFHPDAYNPIFAKIANELRGNPNSRPPSLTSGLFKAHTTIPGSRVVVDPSTGKKSIGPGWKPVWSDEQGNISDEPIEGWKLGIQNLSGRKTITMAKTGQSSSVSPGEKPTNWGGSASISSVFADRRNLDVLTGRGGLNSVMNKFMKDRRNSRGWTAFQTRTPSSVGNFETLSHGDLVRMDLAARAARRKK